MTQAALVDFSAGPSVDDVVLFIDDIEDLFRGSHVSGNSAAWAGLLQRGSLTG